MEKFKKPVIFLVCGLVIFAAGFGGGVYYQKNKKSSNQPSFGNGTPPDMSGTVRPSGMGNRMGMGGGGASGEIISVDSASMTIKTNDGSTKKIYFDDSVTVTKNTTGSKSDLTVGANVMVSGTTNDDKSITSKTIMIQPSDSSD